MRKFLSLLLTVTLLLTLLPPAVKAAGNDSLDNFQRNGSYTDSTFQDVPADAWYAENVAAVYELGLMKGISEQMFSPQGTMTRAEAVTIAARIHRRYSAGNDSFGEGSPWYQEYVDYAQENGILEKNAFSDYDVPATRGEMAHIFANSLPRSELAEINTVTALPDVSASTQYSADIFTLYRAGVLSGNDKQGTFTPDDTISRCQAAAIAARLVQPEQRRKLSFSSPDAELQAAMSLGLLPETWTGSLDEPVSFSDYKQLLDSLIRLCGTTPQQDDWAAAVDVSRFPERETLRSDGLVLLMVAADVLGYTVSNARDHVFSTESRVDYGRMFRQCSQDFSYCTPRSVTLYLPDGSGDVFEDPMIAAPFWMQRRMDLSQRLHFFDYDGDLDFHLDRSLTRDAAVRAVLRLYRSEKLEYDSSLITRKPTELDEKILADAEAVKNAILQNTDDLPCSGTAYYVSNSGSDSADGRTPETAWATLDRVNRAELSVGDGVYFRRGDLWRGQLLAQEGVTYSAYGQGEKPRFYASTENGAGAEKWSLLEGTDNIWVYHRDMMDCGNLVFNEGGSWGRKIVPHYLNGYRSTTDLSKPFDVRAELVKDLDFFSEADSILYDGAPFRYTVMDASDRGEYPEEVVGTLYLRCDRGNPGEVFDSIEFMERQSTIIPADRTVFNNLSLKYCGGNAIFGVDIGYDVSFCEIGWIGGTVQCYTYEDGEPILYGNGVECDGSYSGFSVTDCYIYQCYDTGVSNQDPSESPDVTGYSEPFGRDIIQKDIIYARNVIAYTDMPVEIFFTLADGEDGCRHTMENVHISDNYILYTGYGWYASQKPTWGASCYQTHSTPNHAEGIWIENNVFYLSAGSLLNLRMNSSSHPVFSGNTYVQNPEGVLVIDWNDGGKYYYFDETAADTVHNRIGDSTGLLAD